MRSEKISYNLRLMALHLLHQLNGHLRRGIAEHVDADGELRLSTGLLHKITLQTCQAPALDTDTAADLQTRGIDRYRSLGVANHALEVEHLVVGNHGEVGLAEVVAAGGIRQEVMDELCVAGYRVTDLTAAADEEITRAETTVDPMTTARAGPLVELALDGNVGLKINLTLAGKQLVELLTARRFGVGRDDGYEPAAFFHKQNYEF